MNLTGISSDVSREEINSERIPLMLRRRFFVGAVAIAIVAIISAAVYADLTAGTKAPNFTLPTLAGKSFTLSNCFKNPPQVVVLDLWATWCPPCRSEIPHLVNLQNKFKGKNVTIVGVALDADKSVVADFAKQQRINYTIALDPQGAKLGTPYKIKGIPATYIIDKKGVIRYAHSGFPRDTEAGKEEAANMEKEIRTLLAQK